MCLQLPYLGQHLCKINNIHRHEGRLFPFLLPRAAIDLEQTTQHISSHVPERNGTDRLGMDSRIRPQHDRLDRPPKEERRSRASSSAYRAEFAVGRSPRLTLVFCFVFSRLFIYEDEAFESTKRCAERN